MESARRVGLPPAYEDADIDALCQLIGTFGPIPTKKEIIINLCTTNSAHARPPDFHQRPYPAFTVRVLLSFLSMPTHRSDLTLFFFSFFFFSISFFACSFLFFLFFFFCFP